MPFSIKIAGATFTKIIAYLRKLPQLSTKSNFTESGNSNDGYSYTATGTGYAHTSSLKLPASTDGDIVAKFTASGSMTPMLMADASNNNSSYTGADVGLYAVAGAVYKAINAGVGNGTTNVVSRTHVTGDLVRLRRVGSTWYGDVSSDNGLTWTTIHIFGFTGTAAMYPSIQEFGAAGSVIGPLTMSYQATP